MRKRFAFLVLVLVLAMVAAACSSDGDDTTTTTAGGTSPIVIVSLTGASSEAKSGGDTCDRYDRSRAFGSRFAVDHPGIGVVENLGDHALNQAVEEVRRLFDIDLRQIHRGSCCL